MTTRPQDLIYGVDERPPAGRLALLGLQYVSALLPYLVLVSVVVDHAGLDLQVAHNAIGMAMLAIAVMTVLQALHRGPIGSGFLAPPVVSAIYLAPALLAAQRGGLPLVCGMIAFAGLFEAGLSWVLPRLRKVFPPVVSGMIVMAVGLELGLIGAREFFHQMPGLPDDTPHHFWAAALTLAVMVALSVWGRGILRLLCSLVGVAIGYGFAAALGLVTPANLADIAATPLVGLPDPSFLGYAFDVELVVPFAIAGLASGLRVIGVITTCQRINDADWKRPDVPSIRGGILADGLGCALSGLASGAGTSAAPSLVGISKASGATSRSIAWSVAGWLVLLAFLPKLATAILAMPKAVIGAALIFNGSFMVVAGIQLIGSRPIDVRGTLVIGIPTIIGLSRAVIPHYFEQLPSWIQPILGSILNITLIGAVFANVVFLIGRRRTQAISVHAPGARAGEAIAPFDRIDRQCAEWSVPADVTKRARASVKEILALLVEGRSAEGEVDVRMSYDDFELGIEFDYRGMLPHIASDKKPDKEMIEEQSFAIGLSGFLSNVQADRIDRRAHGDRCHLKLVFET